MAKQGNRRTKMTQTLFKDSLLDILQTKSLGQITIKEICEAADLNRSTFYAYYSSPYDLMASIKKDIVQDVRTLLENCPELPPEERMRYQLKRHLEYTAEHIKEFRAFSSEIGEDFSLPSQVMNIVLAPYIHVLSQGKRLTVTERKRLETFCVFGTIGIVKAWVRRGMDTPVELLSSTIVLLLNNVFAAYL